MDVSQQGAAHPIRPDGWVSVGPAIAWVACGSAEADWNRAFYFGASRWFEAHPLEIANWLREAIDGGHTAIIQTVFADTELDIMLRANAAQLGRRADWHASEDARIAEAARAILSDLSLRLEQAEKTYELFWKGADRLRRSIACGDVAAYGVRRFPTDSISGVREQVQPEVCRGPVTITQIGILSFAPGDGCLSDYHVLWSDILIDGAEVLRFETAPSSPAADAAPGGVAAEPASELPPQRKYSKEALRGWFRLRIHTHGDAPCPTEKEDHAAADSYFGRGIPRGDLRDIRRDLAPENWLKSGPRKRR